MILNKNGQRLVEIRLLAMDREQVVDILEGRLGGCCYDHETVKDDFLPSITQSIECGDLEVDDLPASTDHLERTLLLMGIDAEDEAAVEL